MELDDNEEKSLRSVALQNARAVLLARERAEGALAEAHAALERKTAELVQQREFFQVTLSSIGDAVITTDTDAKVTFLNAVGEELTGWKSSDAIGQPLEEVFNIIQEHTRQRAANPVIKALREGLIVGLANHTVLIARDGREFAIEDSAAPIRGRDGKIIGAVMVFHDVTEHRRAAAALQELAALTALRADIGSALVNGKTLPDVLQKCAEALVKHLGAAFARIWTLNESDKVLELKASAGYYTHLNGAHARIKLGEFKIGRIAQSAQPLLTNDVLHDPNISDPAWALREGMVAFAGYPMLLEGQVIGVMAMFARRRFSPAVLEELAPIAGNIAEWFQRKRAEEALRRSETDLQALADSMAQMAWIADAEGNLFWYNRRWYEYTGTNLEQMKGWGWQTVHDPKTLPLVVKQWTESISTGRPFDMEFPLRAADGTFRWFLTRGNPVRDGDGRVVRWFGTNTDVDEVRRGQEALRASEARYRTLFNSMDEGFCIVEVIFDARQKPVDYRFLEINPAFEKQTGLKDAQGKTIGELAPGYEQHWFDIYGQIALTGQPVRFENRAAVLNRWYEVYAFRVEASESRHVGIIFNDITARKQNEEILQEARNALAQQNQMLDQTVQQRTAKLQETVQELEAFSYSISHDMRSPLRAMQGYADALLLDYRDKFDPQAVNYLERIHRGASRLDLLIRDVLAYSRVAKAELQFQAIHLETLIADIIQNYPNLSPANLRVTVSPLPPVLAHEGLLTQIISNLLGNAVKFATPGQFPEVRISAETTGSKVRVWFADNGIGIEPKHYEQIFQIFGRIYPDKQYEGTGIGLAIVKKAAERLGGSVGVISALGSGSRFWITLQPAAS